MQTLQTLALAASLLLRTAAFAAPPPSASLQLVSPEVLNAQQLNLTKTFDEKSLNSSKLSTDHFNFQIRGTPITIQFYNIIHTLPVALTRACLRQALDACAAHRVAGQANTILKERSYSYNGGTFHDGVHLVLYPQADPALQLTWTYWARVVIALFTVQEYLEYQELHFIIMWELWPGKIRVDGIGRIWGDPGTMEGLEGASA